MKKPPDYDAYAYYEERMKYEPLDTEAMLEWRRWAEEAQRAKEKAYLSYDLGHGYKTAIPPYTRDTYSDALEAASHTKDRYSDALETVRKMADKFTASRDMYISEDLAKRTGITGMLGDKNDDPARLRKKNKTRLCDVYGKGLEYE